MTVTKTPYDMAELRREALLGGAGETVERPLPQIDMRDFAARKADIAEEIWAASADIGFFQLVNHGIPEDAIAQAFALAERFFALPQDVKAHRTMVPGTNAGWEFKTQVRPSAGTPDNKESYQITLPRMAGLWPEEAELAGFRTRMLAFERMNWELGMRVLSCFALKLGFAEDFFTRAHDPASADYQSTLRLVHYMSMEGADPADFDLWRAAAHSDFDCLTLLHQKPGQG
ncbi:MAG TPA: 2-oxoglutarate and iron-dependent oxygenase domain-containing protein, partial [Novosphingobium sp.]|nr:2-oxoglutarate and iron-dependent oxygenase domain-containing protein [Novosphingobium sp.]